MLSMSEQQKNIIRIEPGTLLLIITAMLLLPLLLVGFFSH
jgi:hypothetical protein